MKKNINTIVFYGSLWGLVEATLGYVLHSFSLRVGWFFWFPLSFFFLSKVYKKTQKLSSILFTSFIASAIKLTNLLLPTRLDKVINPAVSIILEGLSIFILFKLVENRQKLKLKAYDLLLVSIGWRVLYTIYILLMPPFFYNVSSLREPSLFANFLLFEGFTNSMIVFAYIKIEERIKKLNLNFKFKLIDDNPIINTTISIITLAITILVQLVL